MNDVKRICDKVRHEGFAFINKWLPTLSTDQVAQMLGRILDIQKQLPGSGIGTVQKLRPRETSDNLLNQYSGEYGLNEFPFHTDLAHWQIPPRFMLLRCINGSKDVKTNLLASSIFEAKIGKETVKFFR